MEINLSNSWEHGSEFHWLPHRSQTKMSAPWGGKGALFGSGRDAFRALLLHSRAARDWRRLWVPSYFCQEVIASFLSTGIDVLVYPDGPEDSIPGFEQVDAKPGDALLIVNFFGLQTMRSIGWTDRSIVEIIEDHTHDPWSDWAWTSNADWCVASLRKVLPVPDGGVLWSPSDQPLPHTVPVSAERRYASLEKLTAMVLKSLYLEGQLVEKEVFRRLAISGESCIASGEISGMPEWTENLVHSFPVKLWRERRCSNHQVLYEALAGVPWLTLLLPEDNSGACPFSGILVFDSQECRTYVHERLIASRIYPAILWPLDEPVIDGIHQKYVDLSNRMLSIHCDMRYSEHEMEYIAAQIRKFGEEYYR